MKPPRPETPRPETTPEDMMNTAEESPTSTRSRTVSRVAAVQALFQFDQGSDGIEPIIVQFERHRLSTATDQQAAFDEGEAPQADRALFVSIARHAAAEHERIMAILTPVLPQGWPMSRLDPVLRALLTAAVAELLIGDAPSSVLINEYVDVAHGFFSGEEPKLVNAILDRLSREPLEAPAPSPDPVNDADDAI